MADATGPWETWDRSGPVERRPGTTARVAILRPGGFRRRV